jgi:hypothetical protein
MKNDYVKLKRAQEPRFLNVDVVIWDELTPLALKVYGQLRKLVCFTSEIDDAEITIKNLALKSGVSERSTYTALNELEFEHFIIQRLNRDSFRHGKANYFSVSQTYEFFKTAQDLNTPAKNDMGVQTLTTPANIADVTANIADVTAKNDILIDHQSFHQSFHQTTTTEPKPVVVVEILSKTLSEVEQEKLIDVFNSHPLETKNIKNVEDFLSAALFSILNREKNITRGQRLRGIISLMKKKMFEEPPKWNKSSRDLSIPSTIDFQEHNAGVKGYEWVGEWIKKQKNSA